MKFQGSPFAHGFDELSELLGEGSALAYAYFSGLERPELMSLHKLAVCCGKTGEEER